MAAAPSSSSSSSSSSIHHHHHRRLLLPQLPSTTSSSPLIRLSQISPAPKSLGRRCFRCAGAKQYRLQVDFHYNYMPISTTTSTTLSGSSSSSCCNPKSCSWKSKSKSSVIHVPAAAANCRSADDDDGEVTTTMMIRKLLLKHHEIQKMPDLALGLISSLILTAMDQQPALANIVKRADEDWTSAWITAGLLAFVYLFVMPPIIFTWLRLRWYKRKLPEMYLQFMFVFLFYPSVLLWAPFLNFRMMPTDPTMKYPWSTPSQASSLEDTTK